MDFMDRMRQSQPQPARGPAAEQFEPPRTSERSGHRRGDRRDWLSTGIRIGTGALILIVALLMAAVVWFLWSFSPASQDKLVDGSKLQAVFLNTGQVYFGNVQSLNKDYLVLGNVYYLQSSGSTGASSSSSSQNVSLVKLGCELHKPYDAMVINTTEVTFWENLQADGQVAKAVAQFQKENPNGQTCSNQPAPTSSDLQNQNTSTKKQ